MNFSEPSPERASYDMIEEIAESIVGEKWEELVRGVGDLKLWKEKIDTDLAGVKQEIVRVQNRFENLQKAVLGKVSEYGEGIQDLGAEIKALEKVLGNIISPLTKNIKDLERVTKKLT
jgi:septation ring formation regulator EzrA